MKRHIPNALSLFRLVAVVPAAVLIAYGQLVPAAILFAVAAATDYVDGALSRRWQVTSVFGQKIDQEADKVLVSGTLLFLAVWYMLPLAGVVALIFIGRDLYVNALRAKLRLQGLAPLPSSFIAKSKTTVQMVAIVALMAGLLWGGAFMLVGQALLIVAALLTLYTLWQYRAHAQLQLKQSD